MVTTGPAAALLGSPRQHVVELLVTPLACTWADGKTTHRLGRIRAGWQGIEPVDE